MASKPERLYFDNLWTSGRLAIAWLNSNAGCATKSFLPTHVDVWTQIVGGRLWGPSRPAPFRPVAFAAGDYLLLGTLVQLLGQRHIDGTARLAHCATGKLSRGGRGSGRGRAHAC